MFTSHSTCSRACALEARLMTAIVDSESRIERAELLGAFDYLTHAHASTLEAGIEYAETVLNWLTRGGIGLLLAVDSRSGNTRLAILETPKQPARPPIGGD